MKYITGILLILTGVGIVIRLAMALVLVIEAVQIEQKFYKAFAHRNVLVNFLRRELYQWRKLHNHAKAREMLSNEAKHLWDEYVAAKRRASRAFFYLFGNFGLFALIHFLHQQT